MEAEKPVAAAAVQIGGGHVAAQEIAGRDIHNHYGPPPPEQLPRFRSNVQAHRNPLVGRNELLRKIGDHFASTAHGLLVLHGPPGVGKSELAREFARRQGGHYSGGTFEINVASAAPEVELARIGQNILGLRFPSDLAVRDQAQQTLYTLAAMPALLIYDNLVEVEALRPWLPPAGTAAHVLITTVIEDWDPGWASLEIKPLSDADSLKLIEELAGAEVAQRRGRQEVELAGGLPVQLCAAAATLAKYHRRGRLDSAPSALAPEADQSFRTPYGLLEDQAQLLLQGIAFLRAQRLPRKEIAGHFQQALSWSQEQVDQLVESCIDLHLLEGGEDLRMHQLIAQFVLRTEPNSEQKNQLQQLRSKQAQRLVEAARQLRGQPARADLAAAVLLFPLTPAPWEEQAVMISMEDGETIGYALYEIGRFAEAQPWHERAVAAQEQGDEQGRVNHQSLGRSLREVGNCLSRSGRYEEAQLWHERAVAAQEQGDEQGRVDHESLGLSLHEVGYCLSSMGKYEEAQDWYERAVAAKEQNDEHGRVDHQSLGRSLHGVGYCLSRMRKYEEAQGWYERAVTAKKQGDMHGRVDHESLGRSLHLLGYCLSSTGKYEEARVWYERAVKAQEQGDVHGRVDHQSLGISLNQMGYCLSSMGKYEEARVWYERAVTAQEQGDVHGRVDHENLGRSLHQVGYCLWSMEKHEEAQGWYERAVTAKEKGDVHGRLDRKSLAISLRAVAQCCRQLGLVAEALKWEKRADQT